MADTETPAEAAARLERALDRIAALAGQVVAGHEARPPPAPAAHPAVDAAAVAERLDALIERVRAALAGRAG